MSLINSTTGEVVARRSLAENEQIIATGLTTFVEVGTALAEIRDAKLFPHDTFEDYCRDRWGFDRRRASALIIAAEVSEISDTPLDNESQAAALAPLKDDPEAANQALQRAIAEAEAKGAKLTAKLIKDAVDSVLADRAGEAERGDASEGPESLPPSPAQPSSDDGGDLGGESAESAPLPADPNPPSSDHLEDPAGESSTGEDEGTANDPSSPKSSLDQRSKDLAEVGRRIKQVSEFFQIWSPAELHELNDPRTAESVRLAFEVIAPWWEQYKQTQPPRLHVVNGEQP